MTNQLQFNFGLDYNKYQAKPFLKWAGGKSQLLIEIAKRLPPDFKNSMYTYIEPFVGSGAVLFWLLSNYPQIKKAIINDINSDLINTYRVISLHPTELIEILKIFQNEYHDREINQEKKVEYYYQKRQLYNSHKNDDITQAALFIFLNRTCFNGLYRVNKDNNFNVPIGSYKKPKICDSENIMNVSKVLQKVEILIGDYKATLDYADNYTFFYFDPPYKPLNSSSSFNSYTKDDFNDEQQIRLKHFCDKLDKLQYKWMLSNSDVKGVDESNNFFDDLYSEFQIDRIKAKRSINSNATKRGEIDELLITNYKHESALQIA